MHPTGSARTVAVFHPDDSVDEVGKKIVIGPDELEAHVERLNKHYK